MARRQGKAWINGLGWVSKKPTQERDYTGYERAADAFLLRSEEHTSELQSPY